MKVSMCTQFLKMQGEALDFLTNLIEFDKEQEKLTGEKAEKTLGLKAFIDTQRKALAVAETLLNKHKDSLLEIERKADEEAKKKIEAENAKRKAEQRKEAVKKDLKKAKADESSLFADVEETAEEKSKPVEIDQFKDEEQNGNDEYGFEENDVEEDEL